MFTTKMILFYLQKVCVIGLFLINHDSGSHCGTTPSCLNQRETFDGHNELIVDSKNNVKPSKLETQTQQALKDSTLKIADKIAPFVPNAGVISQGLHYGAEQEKIEIQKEKEEKLKELEAKNAKLEAENTELKNKQVETNIRIHDAQEKVDGLIGDLGTQTTVTQEMQEKLVHISTDLLFANSSSSPKKEAKYEESKNINEK